MMLPPSSFAREFRAHVVPKLTAACELHGLFVALRLETATRAHAEVMGVAWEHDAAHLPEEHFEHLETWAMDTLLARACVKREEIETRNAGLEHVTADVERWLEACVAQ
jgi:hypothetical protein